MKKLHEDDDKIVNIVSSEGQRGSLCSNKMSSRCPSLDYEDIGASGSVSDAYDILFNKTVEVINNRKILYESYRNLRKSIHIETGK
ncbi:MAG: hypothetical protein WCV68_00630 [Candidatus Paceibacterota bacterium]|jgi:hypothetical protein